MAKRKLNRRQAWRVEKIQAEREKRAAKRNARADESLSEGDLGEEQYGRIIAHYGTLIDVEACDESGSKTTDAEIKRCHFRTNLGSLVTGDKVIWRDGKPHGVIVARAERSSALARPDPYGDMKTVAANIDRIIITIAPYPEAHANLVDRYLVASEASDIKPIILLNKVDRVDDSNHDKLMAMLQRYHSLGYEVLTCSTKTEDGLDELKSYLKRYTSVFVGQSGVGKSSLVNILLPHEEDARVGGLSEATQKGQHTTTTAQLYHFPGGGHLIDSPGIREFGLWHMEPSDVIEGFIEFRPYLGHCKFRDCAHQQEPGCALLQALDEGRISEERWLSYQNILGSLERE